MRHDKIEEIKITYSEKRVETIRDIKEGSLKLERKLDSGDFLSPEFTFELNCTFDSLTYDYSMHDHVTILEHDNNHLKMIASHHVEIIRDQGTGEYGLSKECVILAICITVASFWLPPLINVFFIALFAGYAFMAFRRSMMISHKNDSLEVAAIQIESLINDKKA